MTTLAETIETVYLELSGYTTAVEQASYLTSGVNASALSIPVADGSQFSPGVVEVGSELVYVESVDQNSGVLTAAPFGRGYRGTVASAHDENSKVVNSPRFPRATVKRAVSEAIVALSPDLFTVEVETSAAPTIGTEVPITATNVIAVLGVEWNDRLLDEWVPIRTWSHDRTSGAVNVYDYIGTDRDVRVRVAVALAAPVDEEDDIEVPGHWLDLIRLGAHIRLLPFLEASNTQPMTVVPDVARMTGATASQLGRQIYQQYQIRLAEERARLLRDNPIRAHHVR